MDSEPKTRRESKKTKQEKKGGIYSSKHVRQLEKLSGSDNNTKHTNTPPNKQK